MKAVNRAVSGAVAVASFLGGGAGATAAFSGEPAVAAPPCSPGYRGA
jgi:hypothetical protein